MFQEDNVQHEVHTGCHTHNGLTHTHTEQAGWWRHKCTSWCSLKVCKHVRIRTNTRNMMPSHIFSHTSGWLSAQVQRRERTRDRRDVAHFPNILPGPRLHQLHFHTHTEEVHCISTAYACKSTENGIISDTHVKEKKRFVWMLRSWKERMHMPGYISRSKLWFE